MTADDDMLLTATQAKRNWRFDLIIPLFFHPRATLARVAADSHANWRTPILLLALAAVLRALVDGWIKSLVQGGEIALPPGFEYYTPEQMAQFQQAATATNNNLFNYVLPAIGALLGIVAVWLVMGWLLHLVLTLLGGRSTSQAVLNMAAWASLPLLLRFGVQIVSMLVTRTVITAPGLSGFAPSGAGFSVTLFGSMLTQVDIYLVWQTILLVIGARLVSQLSAVKCWAAVLGMLVLVMALRALPATVLAQFDDLTIIQPFL